MDAASTPQPVGLVSSRDDQAQFADRKLPATARQLEAAAEAAGWAYHHRWSLVAVPTGHRASNRHKIIECGHLLYVVGVRVAGYKVRAWAVWHDPGGFESGAIWDVAGIRQIGVTGLISYIKGE